MPHHSTRVIGNIPVKGLRWRCLIKSERALSYVVKYSNLPRIPLIVLSRPCFRSIPGVYYLSSPVNPRRVIGTGVYSKPAFIQKIRCSSCRSSMTGNFLLLESISRVIISGVMDIIETNTCIRFIGIAASQESPPQQYLLFSSEQNRCTYGCMEYNIWYIPL